MLFNELILLISPLNFVLILYLIYVIIRIAVLCKPRIQKYFACQRRPSKPKRDISDEPWLKAEALLNQIRLSLPDRISFEYSAKDTIDFISKLRWAESNDREVVDWKRCRSVIEHENNLINSRLNWFFTSHAFLLTLGGFQINSMIELLKNTNSSSRDLHFHFDFILYAICFVGFSLCCLIYISVSYAQDHVNAIHNWWDHTYSRDINHPPLQNNPVSSYRTQFALHRTPLILGIVWVLLIVVGFTLGHNIMESWSDIMLTEVFSLAALIGTISGMAIFSRGESTDRIRYVEFRISLP